MRNPFVLIDDGHGEDTIGKWSPVFSFDFACDEVRIKKGERFKENWVNERVSLFFAERLIKRGISFEFIAPGKNDISLKERKKVQNKYYQELKQKGFDPITISIHANAFGNLDEWNDIQGVETFHKNSCPNSLKLAQIVQKEVMEFRKLHKPYNKRTNRGVKTANYYIFREFEGTTILFESEFMTNFETLKLLCSTAYQGEIAEALTKSVIQYYK